MWQPQSSSQYVTVTVRSALAEIKVAFAVTLGAGVVIMVEPGEVDEDESATEAIMMSNKAE